MTALPPSPFGHFLSPILNQRLLEHRPLASWTLRRLAQHTSEKVAFRARSNPTSIRRMRPQFAKKEYEPAAICRGRFGSFVDIDKHGHVNRVHWDRFEAFLLDDETNE